MMQNTQKSYKGKDDFVKDIKEQFGSDVRFNACSSTNMDANEAFDFLIMKNKISIDTSESVSLDPNMKMCDEKGQHNH
jgi:probable metal-binding protein